MKLLASTTIAVIALTGCHRLLHRHPKQAPKSYPTSAPAPLVERAEGSFRPPPAPMLPVKQGPSPLAYIVESGGPIRIVDAGNGATIATGFASPRSIVSVDEHAGVRIGNELIVKGPMASGRVYQIYLDQQSENVMTHELIRPSR